MTGALTLAGFRAETKPAPEDKESLMSWYDDNRGAAGYYVTAEVCLMGHVTTSDLEGSPGLAAKFCTACGARTIQVCPNCNSAIRGQYRIPGMFGFSDYSPPNHRHNCGVAFPWTADKIAAAKEYAAEIEGLNDSERTQLQGVIDDLASGGARTELAVHRFQQLMRKAG